MLTYESLLSRFHYDPEVGVFTRKSTGKSYLPGKSRYISIEIDGRMYAVHRLAWLYMTGRWPIADIDHINLNRHDNRFCNLREATRSQNLANRKALAANTTGFKGVSKCGRKYTACISVNGRNRGLGVFETAEEAHEAYRSAAIKTYGDFARLS